MENKVSYMLIQSVFLLCLLSLIRPKKMSAVK